MRDKRCSLIWMTFLGQTLYENLNPYWSFCEKIDGVPDRIELFHAAENRDETSETVHALSVVSQGFDKKHQVQISSLSFDDENVQDFYYKAEERFIKLSSEKVKLCIDLSPTTWSFVPVYLIKLTQKYRDMVKSTGYMQYTDHHSRRLPYPMIPYKGTVYHDFLTLTAPSRTFRTTDCSSIISNGF